MSDVTVYTFGLCHCSVCAPKDMPREKVRDAANIKHPTGLDRGWDFDEVPTFSGGQPNPCECDSDAGRMHYLLAC